MLFYVAGVFMFAAQTGTGALMLVHFNNGQMAKPAADSMIFLICLFVASFSYSWGPLGWLVSLALSIYICVLPGKTLHAAWSEKMLTVYAWAAMQVPSEIHTIETRLAGQTLTVFVNFLASFIIGAHPLWLSVVSCSSYDLPCCQC